MKKLLLISSSDCSLCREAYSLLRQFDLDNLDFEEVDIYTKRNYVDKYWDKIPVLLKGESELLWPFDKNDISNFLNL